MKQDLHRQSNPQSTVEEAWYKESEILIDVRSPQEFAEGSLPRAINIPLLSNSEKATIGILYKHFGQEAAIKEGYQIFEPKLDSLIAQFSTISKQDPITVYCARGGMRSQVITSFMRALGFNAKQMTGGYKEFRNWNLKQLESFTFTHPVILQGKTGVGKTLVLNQLENALDLEGLAHHRGSLFGGVGKTPVSQKTFEASLMKRLESLNNTKPIYIEGESRKIGDVSIPNPIFQQMKKAPTVILLEAEIKTRVSRTVQEYVTEQPLRVPEMRQVIEKLKIALGKKQTDLLLADFDAGDYGKCFEYILLNYYDRKYTHSMKGLTYATTISSNDITEAASMIKQFMEESME